MLSTLTLSEKPPCFYEPEPLIDHDNISTEGAGCTCEQSRRKKKSSLFQINAILALISLYHSHLPCQLKTVDVGHITQENECWIKGVNRSLRDKLGNTQSMLISCLNSWDKQLSPFSALYSTDCFASSLITALQESHYNSVNISSRTSPFVIIKYWR